MSVNTQTKPEFTPFNPQNLPPQVLSTPPQTNINNNINNIENNNVNKIEKVLSQTQPNFNTINNNNTNTNTNTNINNNNTNTINDVNLNNNNTNTNKTETQKIASSTTSNFNPMTHFPPRYDLLGFPKPPRKDDIQILQLKDKIKIPWGEVNTNKSKAHTQSELKEIRKKEHAPDITYDLDKDGYIGARDYVIAKRFDVDQDGKLNEIEKKNAYEGLSNNIEDNYIWNITNHYGTRILQKRGKIIEGEDFLPIRDTYPVHPLSKINPKYKTFTELKEARIKETKDEISQKQLKWQKNNPPLFGKHEVDIKNFCNTTDKFYEPKYHSINEIKKEKHKQARIKAGLDANESDIKDKSHDPTLAYVYDPVHKTKRDIDAQMSKENLEEGKRLMHVQHKNDVERLNERESEIFAKMFSRDDRMTFEKIKEKRKKEINDYNIKTFSKQTIGVHGHELPKFSECEDSKKEFWKNSTNYCENPKWKSQCEYLENIKYYKPPGEDLLLNEHRAESPKWRDPFKREYHPLPKKKIESDDVIIKVNNLNLFKNFDPNKISNIDINNPRQKHIYRWTTLVAQFAPNKFKKGRFFDSLPPDTEKPSDNKEIFSSFAPNGIFTSDYMNNVLLNNKTLKEKKNETIGNENVESIKNPKGSLFQKFSADSGNGLNSNVNNINKDGNKKVVKNTEAITKAF
jgi:hypothetical protein